MSKSPSLLWLKNKVSGPEYIINLHYFIAFCITVIDEGTSEGRMATKAEMLRNLRLEKRLTQAEVAAKLKVSQSTYSATERGLKPRAVEEAMETVNRMRFRSVRTDGGNLKAGRRKD